MQRFKYYQTCWLIILSLVFVACEDSDEPNVEVPAKYANGFLIANEGPFQNGSGTVSFYSYDSATVTNDVFQTVNNRPLGNVLQSISVYNDEVFMVINNAEKVEVADTETFESVATIEGLAQARYFQAVSADKAYVSEWINGYGGQLSIIDLNTYEVSDAITTGLGPERMLLDDNKLYVVCSGGYSTDSVVTVIDTDTDEILTSIEVGVNPSGIVKDEDGFIWVLCKGNYTADYSALENSGSLYKINPSTNTVESSISFNNFYSQPSDLVIDDDGETIYYSFNGGIYKMDTDDTALPSTSIITGYFYGLGYDPESDYLIASDAGDYTSSGKIVRYDSEDGTVIDEFTVGVTPNGGFYFPAD
ncbi:YncE family protein [Chondrinema litorale]|uniref:YncE family protein n=1 Tax=Chondrinema litorale TaxID=2994555 RepID=UPI002543255C|nr:DUF5074 domain-containing protein [Chondrinema litorale]UZR98721.1 hypothetical protein OQ292_32450 [Chondrinema litorale]